MESPSLTANLVGVCNTANLVLNIDLHMHGSIELEFGNKAFCSWQLIVSKF